MTRTPPPCRMSTSSPSPQLLLLLLQSPTPTCITAPTPPRRGGGSGPAATAARPDRGAGGGGAPGRGGHFLLHARLGPQADLRQGVPVHPPAPLPTSGKYSAGLPVLAYGVLKRADDIVDDMLAQINPTAAPRARTWTGATTRSYAHYASSVISAIDIHWSNNRACTILSTKNKL